MRINSETDLIVFLQKWNGKVYVWGSGAYGKLIGEVLNERKILWDGYYDNFFEDTNIGLNGKNILSGKLEKRAEAIYLLSMRNYTNVYEQLIGEGVSKDNIIWFGRDFYKEIEEKNGYTLELSQKIRFLKNTYYDEKCIIVGNGPSLRREDLERIGHNTIKSFGCNEIYRAYDKVSWRPDFYFISDVNGIREDFQDGRFEKEVIEQDCRVFLRSSKDIIEKYSSYSNIYFFNQVYSNNEDRIGFSEECHKNVYIGYTVTYIMLQMAIYMGFKNIYLIGIDHSYSQELRKDTLKKKDVANHTEMIGEVLGGCYMADNVEKAFLSAFEYANRHSVRIYNATRGGELEIFERIGFEEIFNGK